MTESGTVSTTNLPTHSPDAALLHTRGSGELRIYADIGPKGNSEDFKPDPGWVQVLLRDNPGLSQREAEASARFEASWRHYAARAEAKRAEVLAAIAGNPSLTVLVQEAFGACESEGEALSDYVVSDYSCSYVAEHRRISEELNVTVGQLQNKVGELTRWRDSLSPEDRRERDRALAETDRLRKKIEELRRQAAVEAMRSARPVTDPIQEKWRRDKADEKGLAWGYELLDLVRQRAVSGPASQRPARRAGGWL